MWSISRSTIGSGLQAINHFINIPWLRFYSAAIRLKRPIKKVIDLRSYLIFLVASSIPTFEVTSPMPKDLLTDRLPFNFADEHITLLALLIFGYANKGSCDVVGGFQVQAKLPIIRLSRLLGRFLFFFLWFCFRLRFRSGLCL